MTDEEQGTTSGGRTSRMEFACRALNRSALFRNLPPERLDDIASHLRTRRYRKRQVIFTQGDEGDALHLVESGLVRISAEAADGREAIIGEVRPGETFGELVLVEQTARSATAIAVEDTVTLSLMREPFEALLRSDEVFRRGIFEALARELRRATSHLGELHFLDLSGRLAARLTQMAEEGSPEDGGEIRLPGRHSQADLAAMIGGSRQRVNQHLGELAEMGLIRLEGRDIIVLDLAALASRGEW